MNPKKSLPVNLKLKARQNRRQPTEAESILWEAMRSNQLKGYKFRRQHPIPDNGQFILDFYCHSKRLAVEVDGEYHNHPDQQELDTVRTKMLEELGISVLRVTNEEVVGSLEGVMERILAELTKRG